MEDKNLKTAANHHTDEQRDIQSQRVDIKKGSKAYKTAEIAVWADPQTNETKTKTLTLTTYHKKPSEAGWDFNNVFARWYCEGEEEIGKLKALLDGVVTGTATWRKIEPGSASEAIIRLLDEGKVASENVQDIATALAKSPAAVAALASSGAGRVFTQAIQQASRESTLLKLDKAVHDTRTTESELQKLVENEWWLFGGRYIDISKRRGLTVLDQLDIPLICYDGSLHVVELKKANIPDLVKPHRSHFIVGPEVNEAVGQTANYLRELDEQRDAIKTRLGIECSRISATVVIGHRDLTDVSDNDLYRTLRTYSSHLSRIELVTYDQLVANTRNALRIGRGLA